MKKVLITGANSYIGTSFENWVRENLSSDELVTETVDMLGEDWKTKDFSGFDSIFHVAGIAHADVAKVTEEEKQLYYRVNCDLAVECAKKARAEGVRQFVFMSSIIVYGESAGVGKTYRINKDTPVKPANFYGDSKVKAEEGLTALARENFKIVILRPPMIYGKGSKGNYPQLAKLAGKLPLFPKIKNERSMLYIGNLCKFISLMIEREEQGVFFPQNDTYVTTAEMVRLIAAEKGKKMHFTSVFNWAVKLLGCLGGKFGRLANKAFGSMTYDRELSEYKEEYCMYSLEESIRLTEGK